MNTPTLTLDERVAKALEGKRILGLEQSNATHPMDNRIKQWMESYAFAETTSSLEDFGRYIIKDLQSALKQRNDVLREVVKEMGYARKELEKYADYTGATDDDGTKLAIKNSAWTECLNIDELIKSIENALKE